MLASRAPHTASRLVSSVPAYSVKYESPATDEFARQLQGRMPRMPLKPAVEPGPHTDIEGLVDYLDALRDAKARIVEVTHSINYWDFGGVIPLKHHGILVSFDGSGFLTLDFGRAGIEWGVYDRYPDFPEKTYFVKSYKVDADPLLLRRYCEETQPFSFVFHDCAAWCLGLLEVMNVRDRQRDEWELSSAANVWELERGGAKFAAQGGAQRRCCMPE